MCIPLPCFLHSYSCIFFLCVCVCSVALATMDCGPFQDAGFAVPTPLGPGGWMLLCCCILVVDVMLLLLMMFCCCCCVVYLRVCGCLF